MHKCVDVSFKAMKYIVLKCNQKSYIGDNVQWNYIFLCEFLILLYH